MTVAPATLPHYSGGDRKEGLQHGGPSPDFARISPLAPGILRVRVPLPFPPSEVSAWLLDCGAGWTLIDCGVDSPATRAQFEAVLAHPLLEGRPSPACS